MTCSSQTSHLECPQCAKHTIVQHQDTRYVCLSCDWEKDISKPTSSSDESEGNPLQSLAMLIGTGLLFILVL